jgi:hypothetical protein
VKLRESDAGREGGKFENEEGRSESGVSEMLRMRESEEVKSKSVGEV